MELIEFLLIIIGCLTLGIAIAAAVIKVSLFYRSRFGFSVWSGVLLLFLAFILMLVYSGGEAPHNMILPILSVGLCILTLARNIHLAGRGYGFLGMLFQGIMTFLFFLMVIIAIAGLLARVTTHRIGKISGRCSGISREIYYAIILLPVFVMKR